MYSYYQINLAKSHCTPIITWDHSALAKCILIRFIVEIKFNMKISLLLQTLCESNTKLIDSFITFIYCKLGHRNE